MDNIYNDIIAQLPHNSITDPYGRDKGLPYTDGDSIICHSKEQANAIADLFDALGYVGMTSRDGIMWLSYVD